MYGFTGFSVGTVRSTNCLIPVQTMIDGGTNKVSISSRAWNSLITLNNQPTFLNSEFIDAAKKRIENAEEEKALTLNKIIEKISKK
jgi:hypothetical protein